MNYSDTKTEMDYLSQFYTLRQVDTYARGDSNKVRQLYALAQPKSVPIASLMGESQQKNILVSSPDGWVPVLDCIEKIKSELYTFTFSSGRIITASHDHLYQDLQKVWRYARDLNIGDILLSETDEFTDRITEIVKIDKKTKVYDLAVNHDNHRYYTNGICSHNSGKSLVKMNIAVNWLEMGLNGVFVTLELSEGLCAMRVDSMITKVASKNILREVDNVDLRVHTLAKTLGKFRIKYLPAQSTVNDIRAYVKELQIQSGMRIDFLCVDYLDLMMPVSVKVNPSDAFAKDKYVSEELRNLASELNVLFVTSSQLNRSSVDETEFDHSHIAGGISKINTADNVFGIFTSMAMRERGKYQLQCMKTRNSSGVGQKSELSYDVDTLRISDGDTAGNTMHRPSANSILNQIKTKNTAAPIVTETAPVRGSVESNKLKQMLATLKHKD